MTSQPVRTVTASRRPDRRAARPNVVQLVPGRTPLPVGSAIEGGRR
jgi:hypothetical protein